MRWNYPGLDINSAFPGLGVIIIIIIIVIIVYVYVSSACTDLVEKQVRFPQGMSLVLYFYFRIFYFCIVELWVLVNLNYIYIYKKKTVVEISLPYSACKSCKWQIHHLETTTRLHTWMLGLERFVQHKMLFLPSREWKDIERDS